MLTDGIITLRALEPIDVDTLFRWENDPSLWSVGVTLAPYSRKQLWDYVNNYDGDIYSAKQLRLMVSLSDSGETIGTLDFYDFDATNSRCGVGILIATPYQRQGFGLRALHLGEESSRNGPPEILSSKPVTKSADAFIPGSVQPTPTPTPSYINGSFKPFYSNHRRIESEKSVRLRIDRPRVISSVYSRSFPTATPRAS